MSILLDALKKSESQRQLGETPTLQTASHDIDPSADAGQPWVPLLMLAVAFTAMTWFGLSQYRPVELSPVTAEQPPQTADTGADSAAPPRRAAPGSRQAAKTPVMDYQAEAGVAASQEQPDEPEETALARVSGPSTVISESSQEEPGQVPASAQAVVPEEALYPGPPEGELVNPYEGQVLSYWQIPQALRDTMPEMHISVLVYAKQPEDRFLLIDGNRLREKDEHGNGLVLEEIQSDRAIFTYRNYRFHVKS